MNIQFIKPAQVLAPFIDRYWLLDYNTELEIHMPQIFPGVGMDLFLHYKNPFVARKNGKLPTSHIVFSGERACEMLPMKNIGFIAVRFKAGMFKHFTEIPFTELTDRFLDVEEIWSTEGKNLLNKITATRDISNMAAYLDAFLLKQLNRHKKESPLWDRVVHELYYNHSDHKLSELSQKLRISYRHFRRKMIEETGFAPKHFQQLARFHATLKPLLINKEKKYLPVALDNGYFDQSHFIKEFKTFTQYTPARFLQEKNFMSHFYYPSL